MAHYTLLKYMNPLGSFYLSHRQSSGPASMGGHHFHTNYEIFYLVEGERYYFIKDRTYYVKKGDLIFIKPYDLHTTQDATILDHERILIKLNKEFIVEPTSPDLPSFDILFEQYNHVSFDPLAQHTIDHIYDQLLLEIKNEGQDLESMIRSLLIQMLIFTARYAKQTQASEPSHINPTHAKISEILKYINQNYAEKISLNSIAVIFHFSTYYLSRTFKEVTGFSFVEYLNNLRVTKAQKLLRDTTLNVIEIASQVGFGNQSHFGRIFKGITGISPLQYRKNIDDPSLPTTFKKGKILL